MITILRGHRGNVDFGSPLKMDQKLNEKFIEFLGGLFEVVEEEAVSSFRSDRLGDKNFSREWTKGEYMVLFQLQRTNEEVGRKLGRSWFSVEMKRMQHMDDIMRHAKNEGVHLYKADKESLRVLVEKFVEERRQELIKKKNEREQEKKKKKEKEDRKKEYERLKQEVPKDEKLLGLPNPPVTKQKIEEKKQRLSELSKEFD